MHALNTKHLLLSQTGHPQESLALLRHAIALGREHELGLPLQRALHNLSHTLNAYDRFAEAIEIQLELLERERRDGNRVDEQRTLAHYMYSRWRLGDADAIDPSQFTLADQHVRAARLNHAVYAALFRGDVAEARAALDEYTALRDSGEGQMQIGFRAFEAAVLRAEGNPREALTASRAGLDAMPDPLHPFYKDSWFEGIEAAFDLSDTEEVEEMLGRFDRLPPSDRTPLSIAQATRFRGRLLALRGDRDGALDELARAAVLFRELGTPYFLGMALFEQAELGGDDSAALLAGAREIFERLGVAPWLARVDALESLTGAGVLR